jgi:hypothetical protein
MPSAMRLGRDNRIGRRHRAVAFSIYEKTDQRNKRAHAVSPLRIKTAVPTD